MLAGFWGGRPYSFYDAMTSNFLVICTFPRPKSITFCNLHIFFPADPVYLAITSQDMMYMAWQGAALRVADFPSLYEDRSYPLLI